MPAAPDTSSKARAFAVLHQGPATFLMPNAWDAGSARLLSAAGFSALGTTSAGIAYALGRPDGAGLVSRSEMMDAVQRIAEAVSIPVSADLEAGFGARPEDVAETVRLARAAGVVGCNLEDAADAQTLYPLPEALDRLRAAREATASSEAPFTLTARTDVMLQQSGPGALAEAIDRCQRFLKAGADCVFVPGIGGVDAMARLVAEVPGPVSVVMGLSGSAQTMHELRALGVRRASTGGSLARAVMGLLRRSAATMMADGRFDYAQEQIPDAELCAFFALDDAQARARHRPGPSDAHPAP